MKSFIRMKLKRILASLLAIVMLILNISTTLPIDVYAGTLTFKPIGNQNIWSGSGPFMNEKNRKTMYMWQASNGATVFCIEHGKGLHATKKVTRSTALIYQLNNYKDSEYISSDDDFVNLALICNWIKEKGTTPARYAAGQAGVWAITSYSDFNRINEIVSQMEPHVRGTTVAKNDLLAYINEKKKTIGSFNIKGLYTDKERAISNPIQMLLVDGKYSTTIDLSSSPELAKLDFSNTEDFEVKKEGNSLKITYKGEGSPEGKIFEQKLPPILSINKFRISLFSPQQVSDQTTIGPVMAKISDKDNNLYISFEAKSIEVGEPEVEVYKHSETFEANYNVALEKKDYETNESLEGATFEVLESFDFSQLGDGENGSVASKNMSPNPSTWDGFRVFGKVITDKDGKASYSDKRYYNYDKIYVGHPEPKYLEVPEKAGEQEEDNSAEIAAIEEANKKAKAKWEAIVNFCEEQGYFHDNDIEVAREQMLEDRQETYDSFINLRYKYTFREIQARNGYILHNLHNDDEMVEVIETSSSQAGANTTIEHIEKGSLKDIPTNTINTLNTVKRNASLRSVGVHSDIIREFFAPFTLRVATLFGSEENAIKEKLSTDISLATNSEVDGEIYLEENKSTDQSNERSTTIMKAGANSIYNDIDTNKINSIGEIKEEKENRQNERLATKSNAALSTSLNNIVSDSLRSADDEISTFASNPNEDDEADDFDEPEDNESVELPSPTEDDVEALDIGITDKISHTFIVFDNRTEGEIHINKRDLEIYNNDKDNSYARVQGDATLEGAVYGLYAAGDIYHPDGKTGLLYKANTLVAIATTDINGDASFLTYTEESPYLNINPKAPKTNRWQTWIGRPLILGTYYVKEIARSEGYELSISGKNKLETNKAASNENIVIINLGRAAASPLFHEIDEHDGTTNDSIISYRNIKRGLKLFVSGYPKGAKFYKVSKKEHKEKVKEVKKSFLATKTDATGTPIYMKAKGGEIKIDKKGKPIIKGLSTEQENESLAYVKRLNYYYKIDKNTFESLIENKTKLESTIDTDYLKEEVNKLLKKANFKESVTDTYKILSIVASNNKEFIAKFIDFVNANSFYDSIRIERIENQNGKIKVLLKLDYTYSLGNKEHKNTCFLDMKTKKIYVKKEFTTVDNKKVYTWLDYIENRYTLDKKVAILKPKYEIVNNKIDLDCLDETKAEYLDRIDNLKTEYKPIYETYKEGEILLDKDGNPYVEIERKYEYEEVERTTYKEESEEIKAKFNEETSKYEIEMLNNLKIDDNATNSFVLRIQTKESKKDDKDYSNYLIEKGASVDVLPLEDKKELNKGSYIEKISLVYPGQLKVYEDGNTRNKKVQVLERVIKQAIKISKDISVNSYEDDNTYKIHKDPFTTLFAGFFKSTKKFIPDFNFKVYLVSDLEKANLLSKKEDGSFDYEKLFKDETKRSEFDKYAIEWDTKKQDKDNDLTTLTASIGKGSESYYATSRMLPYGRYVIVEQVPTKLLNKHYEIDKPKEIILPFVPQVEDGKILEDVENTEYIYRKEYTPEELTKKFQIRFNEEEHIINAHSHNGDFKVFKYGLKKSLFEQPYENKAIKERYKYGQSENGETQKKVFFERDYDKDGNLIGVGVEKENVAAMRGKLLSIDGKYAPSLVPYTVVDPRMGEAIDDEGNIGNRDSDIGKDGKFNFIAFAKKNFENRLYKTRLRIEKLDSQTKENIIHDSAIFKIYAAKRDVSFAGSSSIKGSGNVIFKATKISGTRKELEARGDVEGIIWNEANKTYDGVIKVPVYDEKEQIIFKDNLGNDVGLFKAVSTENEIVKEDGSVEKQKVGYIELLGKLSAGVYVLVEVKAPKGYQASKPVAFEIYKDESYYYENGNENERTKAERYQYAKVLSNEELYEDSTKVKINNKPSTLRIHKVEDVDDTVGDVNEIRPLKNVNDKGDLLTYELEGRKEYLEAREDVLNIHFDAKKKLYVGHVEKRLDEFSEELVEIKEEEALLNNNLKPLYEAATGNYSGYAIRFNKYVEGAGLKLYEGLKLEKTTNGYKGVSVEKENGKTIKIKADALATGKHLEITKVGKNDKPNLNILDTKEFDNETKELFFYDLEEIKTKKIDNETVVLDDRGNPICYVDIRNGLAYTKDDYNNIIAYISKNNEKQVAYYPSILENNKIYDNVDTFNDENNLIKHYRSGSIVPKASIWTSTNQAHIIKRLPFGAYILEEEKVPYEQGYIKAFDKGLILEKSSREQDFYYQNDYTKVNIAKIDITTKKEIPDAKMTLYATKLENGKIVKDRVYRNWISGYEYDDKGNQKLVAGKPVRTNKPYFITHIPVGKYILEETTVPYKDGYVFSESIEIEVKETGNVQTFYMEDDYTALEIKKLDSKTNEVIDSDNPATLALYKAKLDDEGKPVFETIQDDYNNFVQIPTYQRSDLVFTWDTEDGKDVSASGREITDEYGDTYIKYAYNKKKIAINDNAHYYIKEDGSTRINYLPIGYYVLVEEKAPKGYASAKPQIIEVKDKGGTVYIHKEEMKDIPININIHKYNDKAKVVKDALIKLYKYELIDPKTNTYRYSLKPKYEFITGSDGTFTKEEVEKDIDFKILGYKEGDLKPHFIDYVEAGKYKVAEEKTPFGFLKAPDIEVEVKDTPGKQQFFMQDLIPNGELNILKLDKDNKTPLEGAIFEYKNKDTNEVIERLTTDKDGKAKSSKKVPIGYIGNDGLFKAYTYQVIEVKAPKDYIRKAAPFEFIFSYVDENTKDISYTYDVLNDINQVRVEKKELKSTNLLEGATLQVLKKESGKEKLIAEWISKKEPIYVKGLKVGKYILREVKTPGKGYALAKDIEFEILEDMTSIPIIEMFDDSTNILIKKTDGNSTNLLKGVKLALKNKDGKIIRQWTTTDQEEVFYGLEPGIYYISEIEALSGYEKAPDKKIEIKDTLEKQEFIFANYRISSTGGAYVPKRKYISFKKIDNKNNPLKDVEFTFYKADGSVLTVAKSDINGIIKLEKPIDGTYTFKETKQAKGYYKDTTIHTMVIKEGNVKAIFNLINYPIARVKLIKKDYDTKESLQGAVFEVISPGKEKLKLISDEQGKISFEAREIGKYLIKEIKAPVGYKKANNNFVVEVNEKGEVVGERQIYNSKKKIGRIIVEYGDNIGLRIPKTGDNNKQILFIIGLISSLSLICISVYKKMKKNKIKKGFLILFCIFSITNLKLNTYANTNTTPQKESVATENKNIFKENIMDEDIITNNVVNEDRNNVDIIDENISNNNESIKEINTKEIKDLSDIRVEEEIKIKDISEKTDVEIKADKLECIKILDKRRYKPEKEINYKGKKYVLKNSQIKKVDNKDDIKLIHKEVIFTNVENDKKLPNIIKTAIKINGNKIEGKEINLVYVDKKDINQRWTNNFRAKLSFVDYDSDEFLFEDKIIKKENALEELKKQDKKILNILNLDDKFYKIDNIAFDKEEFIKNGVVYRNANIYGSKLVKDVVVKYESSLDLKEYKNNDIVEIKEVYEEQKPEKKEKNEGVFTHIISFVRKHKVVIFILFFIFIIFILAKIKKQIKSK